MANPGPPRHIESIIDRQFKLWGLREHLAEEGGALARRELAHLSQGPWITVSKQLGSGGVAIARKAAAELGWQAFDKEILEEIARHTHTRRRLVAEMDEKVIGGLREYIEHLIVPQAVTRGAYLSELTEVVLALAHKGRVILVGRGANWLLDARFGLRVRVFAPLEVRVRQLMADERVDRDEAESRIRRTDDDNRAFIAKVFDKDIDDPAGYDLVINRAEMGEDAAAATVVSAVRAKLRDA